MDLPFLKELEKEEIRFKRFQMSGDGSVRVAGNLRTGFVINIDKEEGGGGTPVVGACCFCDGTCEEETFGQCLSDGGTFQGPGTTCDPNPCEPTGACCDEDGNCTITTEADCAGTYQGDCTECDPNPCSSTPCLGACCVGTDCGLDTEEDCVRNGGTFQGCGTECDPNPCGGGDECFDLGGTPCGPFCCFSPESCLDPFRGCCPSMFYPCYGSVINHCCCNGDPSCSASGPDTCCGDGSCCPGGTTCCPTGCLLGGFCCSEFDPCLG